jgi:hypothetical protein
MKGRKKAGFAGPVPCIPAHPNTVPGDSILRETIGGSQLEY